MKKTLCMLLCLLLILPVFAACANQKDDNDGSTTTANSGSSTTTEEEGTKDAVEEALKLIDVDYNKKTFEILTRKDVGNWTAQAANRLKMRSICVIQSLQSAATLCTWLLQTTMLFLLSKTRSARAGRMLLLPSRT